MGLYRKPSRHEQCLSLQERNISALPKQTYLVINPSLYLVRLTKISCQSAALLPSNTRTMARFVQDAQSSTCLPTDAYAHKSQEP